MGVFEPEWTADSTGTTTDKERDSKARSFAPGLVKMDEKAKLKMGMLWGAWNLVTALPYSILVRLNCPAEVMAYSLASILHQQLLAAENSLKDKPTAMDFDSLDDDDAQADDELDLDIEQFSPLETETGKKGEDSGGSDSKSIGQEGTDR
ncbi:hypothetical protein CBR_g5670 [Chara braunii]|uniref:Uncharacterized protein n=1 Tax=Chara braunii TaxID=69332 RepID=A0A388JRR5_CHABU|nr:hypothetical protein CBR_g5670 [Chara braunii]|eukprot:GBG60496.1 hypothetical protein CBR_g5670 [Chara braunii]